MVPHNHRFVLHHVVTLSLAMAFSVGMSMFTRVFSGKHYALAMQVNVITNHYQEVFHGPCYHSGRWRGQ